MVKLARGFVLRHLASARISQYQCISLAGVEKGESDVKKVCHRRYFGRGTNASPHAGADKDRHDSHHLRPIFGYAAGRLERFWLG